MENSINFGALTNALTYLNNEVSLPSANNHEDLVYVIEAHSDSVSVRGFYPVSAGTEITAATELFLGRFWVAHPKRAYLDYNSEEDTKSFVKLTNKLRECRYEQFFININAPIVELYFRGDLAHDMLTLPAGMN